MSGVTYPPLGTLKPVAEAVWIVDGEAIPFGPGPFKMPFPTRMTVLQLAEGGLLLHSPTPGCATPSAGCCTGLPGVRGI